LAQWVPELIVRTSHYRYRGEDRFDITRKTGMLAFAPTWDMVMGVKDGTLSEEGYTEQYRALLDRSRRTHRAEWKALLGAGQVTLVCFCPPGAFCHRRLLALYLVDLCWQTPLAVTWDGEVYPD